jgi:hypothetical protein
VDSHLQNRLSATTSGYAIKYGLKLPLWVNRFEDCILENVFQHSIDFFHNELRDWNILPRKALPDFGTSGERRLKANHWGYRLLASRRELALVRSGVFKG